MTRRAMCFFALVAVACVLFALGREDARTMLTKNISSGAVKAVMEEKSAPSSAKQLPFVSRDVRIMFIGDSITQGTTANLRFLGKKKQKWQFPKNGTCSYRFHLLKLLNDYLQRNSCLHPEAGSCREQSRRAVAVGPYHSSFGGRAPSWCKEVRGMLGADQTAHGAVWGIEIEEMHEGRAAERHAAMLRLVGLRGKSEVSALRKDGPKDWVVQFRPAVVLVFLGTNDLHTEEPGTVFERLEALLDPLLAIAGGVDSSAFGRRCTFRVVATTLPVHFAADPPPSIPEYNALLLRFNKTIRQPCNASSTNLMECSTCFHLIDGAGAAFAGHTKESISAVTYDLIHPNRLGEVAIAEAIFHELVSQGVIGE